MPEVDVKGYLLNGPEVLMQNLVQLSKGEKQEPIDFRKVLRTFVINTDVKAEISSSGSSATKVSGIVDWIGERKDGEKGVELLTNALLVQKNPDHVPILKIE